MSPAQEEELAAAEAEHAAELEAAADAAAANDGEGEPDDDRRSGDDRRAPAADQTYVVLALKKEIEGPVWLEVAEVTVPPRTKRGTIVRQALEGHEEFLPPVGEQASFRVLDAASAEELTARLEVPPAPAPTLVIE